MNRALLTLVLAVLLTGCSSASTTSDSSPTESTGPAATNSEGADSPEEADEPEAAEEPEEPAPTDDPNASACPWRLEDDKLVHPDREPGSPRKVDIDGEPPEDLIGYLGGCGNWGDCEHVVLRACEGGGYEAVWGPEYAQGIDVGERPEGAELANLIRHGRTASAGCDLPLKTTLKWTGDGWEEGETCAEDGVWGSACGSRPPACD